ncbi:saccharopine dehydrogenase NADP-binding domain-containing protein [Nonomuraea rhodomycinica]|uniref:Saccharopine dehydrogenase NADP-binding domain-containing protein n=1 Tax=Nonomuraea rhodomycinica TaxID=1712872 RepID=A0A7Y6IQ70_9ACTN|nr:saccharopine dehydrogenase NADP-binding domain-containing protein [Nonomuraea rhodomycinica]NUW42386.1 saccharopine dehydrogenase NADP-binding domain-containing protein [Nonomuraea rhodomycinica]
MDAPTVAIYGANGHTGRLVAAELLARGARVLLAGRDGAALDALAAELAELADSTRDAAEAAPADGPARVRTRAVSLDDRDGLRGLAEECAVVVHCAGPFAETAVPVAEAAVAGRCHYVDHAVEPHPVKKLFDTMGAAAERAGIVMVPQLSFYGGVADLLAAAVTEGMTGVDRLTVGYSVTGWRMTPAAVRTAELLIGEIDRVTFADGAQRVGPVEIRNTVFPFPPPVGPRTMIAPFPSGEVVTIPRHVPARSVESQLTASTFEEQQVFTSQDATPEERARTEFTVAVQATAPGGGGRNGHVRGRDIWWVGALASAEAAVRLARGEGPSKAGVLSTAEAFPAVPFLHRLEELGAFTLHL